MKISNSVLTIILFILVSITSVSAQEVSTLEKVNNYTRRFVQCVNLSPGYARIVNRRRWARLKFRNGHFRLNCRHINTRYSNYTYFSKPDTFCIGDKIKIDHFLWDFYYVCRIRKIVIR